MEVDLEAGAAAELAAEGITLEQTRDGRDVRGNLPAMPPDVRPGTAALDDVMSAEVSDTPVHVEKMQLCSASLLCLVTSLNSEYTCCPSSIIMHFDQTALCILSYSVLVYDTLVSLYTEIFVLCLKEASSAFAACLCNPLSAAPSTAPIGRIKPALFKPLG